MDADFFVTGIGPNFARICYAFSPCFLSPFVHLVLILKEPVTAKDLAACKRGRCAVYEMVSYGWVIGLLCVPPGGWQGIGWVAGPFGAGDVVAFAQELDGCCTEGSPTAGIFCFLRWLYQGFAH